MFRCPQCANTDPHTHTAYPQWLYATDTTPIEPNNEDQVRRLREQLEIIRNIPPLPDRNFITDTGIDIRPGAINWLTAEQLERQRFVDSRYIQYASAGTTPQTIGETTMTPPTPPSTQEIVVPPGHFKSKHGNYTKPKKYGKFMVWDENSYWYRPHLKSQIDFILELDNHLDNMGFDAERHIDSSTKMGGNRNLIIWFSNSNDRFSIYLGGTCIAELWNFLPGASDFAGNSAHNTAKHIMNNFPKNWVKMAKQFDKVYRVPKYKKIKPADYIKFYIDIMRGISSTELVTQKTSLAQYDLFVKQGLDKMKKLGERLSKARNYAVTVRMLEEYAAANKRKWPVEHFITRDVFSNEAMNLTSQNRDLLRQLKTNKLRAAECRQKIDAINLKLDKEFQNKKIVDRIKSDYSRVYGAIESGIIESIEIDKQNLSIVFPPFILQRQPVRKCLSGNGEGCECTLSFGKYGIDYKWYQGRIQLNIHANCGKTGCSGFEYIPLTYNSIGMTKAEGDYPKVWRHWHIDPLVRNPSQPKCYSGNFCMGTFKDAVPDTLKHGGLFAYILLLKQFLEHINIHSPLVGIDGMNHLVDK